MLGRAIGAPFRHVGVSGSTLVIREKTEPANVSGWSGRLGTNVKEVRWVRTGRIATTQSEGDH